MRKLFLQILFLFLVLPAISQVNVIINGTLTDTAGYAISNHAVTISADSVTGWFFYKTVYTNNSGYYYDTIPVPGNISQGILFVSTLDCMGILHQTVVTFEPIPATITVDFSICNANSPCQADFTSYHMQGLTVQFMDASAGGGDARYWSFGDGVTSTQLNPIHTYSQSGDYNVLLIIGTPNVPCYDSIIKSIHVWDSLGGPCNASFAVYPDSNALYAYQFIDLSAGNITNWYWNFGDGITSDLQNPSHVYTEPGIYSACLSIHGNDSSCFDFTCDTIIVGSPAPCNAAFSYYHFQTDPLTIHFNNASVGGNGVNLWNFGDGASSTEENPIHTYQQTGQYFVGLSIGDSASGCFAYTYELIQVGDSIAEPCEAAFTAYPDSNSSYYYQFIDQSSGNITNWSWNFGDGMSSELQNPTHGYVEPGLYAVCLSIQGADSICSDIYCDTIVVGNTPTCNAEFSYFQPAARMVYFTNTSTGGNGIYSWNFGDGTFSTETSPVHIFPSGGLYIVGLTIGDSLSSCFDFTSAVVNVWDSTGGAGCHAAFRIDSDSLNPTYTFHFIDQSTGNIISRLWDFGDGSTSTEQNPIHTYSANGTYDACLTIHGADSSCYDVTCKTLAIGTSPACHAEFTYYSDSLNSEFVIQFLDQSTAGTGSISSWFWQFGDGTTSNLQNPVHTYQATGVYLATLTIQGADSACFDYTTDSVFVGTGPGCHAYFTYTIDPPPGNRTVIFTDLSLSLPTSWLWNFGDGTADTVQNPVHTYAAPGTYNVCLQITDNNCTSTFCQDVALYDSSYFHVIYGQVFAGNFPVPMGMAMIFAVDTTGNPEPYFAVCPVDSNGVYYFTMVPDGSYYILATPFDSNGYLPTYYGNSINWEQATLITLGTANNPYNINLVPSNQMSPGPGSASGQINTGDMPATLIDMINMILMNAESQAIGFTPVTSSGTFDFSTLAYGTYYLHAEMPGITSDYVMVNITQENPHVIINMTFIGNSIMGVNGERSIVQSWKAYPNPMNEKVSISLEMKEPAQIQVEIFDMTGHLRIMREDMVNRGSNTIEMSTAALPVGIYLLRIHSGDGLNISTKLVKTN